MRYAVLLFAGLLPAVAFCQETENEQFPADPTAPSAKIEETMVKIRRVEDLDKVIKEVARLAEEIERLKQAGTKDVASLAKGIDGVKQANTALRETIDSQVAEINKQLETRDAALNKRISNLDSEIAEQKELMAQIQKLIGEQGERQSELIHALKTRFDDLETRLTDIPPISVQGFVTGENQAGAAILDLGGSLRVVREEDSIQLQPQDGDSVIRTIRVKEIADGSVLLEIGPWGQTLRVQ